MKRVWLMVVLWAAPCHMARAHDWLALHPPCALPQAASRPSALALWYPRAGLPAVVHAGDRLVLRLQVSSGLTPPPGIQQSRALRTFRAELIGSGTPLVESAEHIFVVPVVDIRPDDPSSLLYRVSLALPAWMAPGTYGLRLRALGREVRMAAAVRVLAPGESMRVALANLPAGGAEQGSRGALRAALAALAWRSVDVWLAPAHEAARIVIEAAELPPLPRSPLPALVLVPPGGMPVVLRVTDGAEPFLLALGACETRFVPFDRQLRALGEHEGAPIVGWEAGRWPAAGHEANLAGMDQGRLGTGAVTIERGPPHRVSSTLAGASVVALSVPSDGLATRIEGATSVDWWLATGVASRTSRPSLIARIHLGPGGHATIDRRPASPPRALDLRIRSLPVLAGVPMHLRAAGAAGLDRVAWQFDERRTAVGARVIHTYAVLGPHRVRALALTEDGRVVRAERAVEVGTRFATGCQVGLGPGGGISGMLLLLVVLLLRRGWE